LTDVYFAFLTNAGFSRQFNKLRRTMHISFVVSCLMAAAWLNW